MNQKITAVFLFILLITLPNKITSQVTTEPASELVVRLFTSSNLLGYLEPCG